MRKKITTVTVKQIQDLDKLAIEKYGVPSLVLMENVRQICKQIWRDLAKISQILAGGLF